MLTKSVKIHRSQGVPDPGIRLLVNLPTGVLLLNLAPFSFSRAAFHAVPQLTERLEEAVSHE